MPVSVVEVSEVTGTIGPGISVPSFSASPVAGDVVYLVMGALATTKTVDAVSGMGATWAPVQAKSNFGTNSDSIWKGTGATGNGAITVTLNSVINGIVRAFLVRGLTSALTMVDVVAVSGTAAFPGPLHNASNAQFVLDVATASSKTTGNTLSGTSPGSGWVVGTSPAALTGIVNTAYRVPTEGTSTAHQATLATGTTANRQITQLVVGASLTEAQVGGDYAEALYLNSPPEAQAGGVYSEVLTFIPPPVMGVAGAYVEIISPKLLPTLGLAGAYLEVLVKMGGSNVHDHTGTQRNVFLLTDGGLVEQIFKTNP